MLHVCSYFSFLWGSVVVIWPSSGVHSLNVLSVFIFDIYDTSEPGYYASSSTKYSVYISRTFLEQFNCTYVLVFILRVKARKSDYFSPKEQMLWIDLENLVKMSDLSKQNI